MLRHILALFEFRVESKPLVNAIKNVDRLTDKTRKATGAANQQTSAFRQLTSSLKGLAAGYTALVAARGLVTLSDEYVRLQNRIQVVTKTQKDFVAAQVAVFKIARDVRTPVKNVTEMFQRYSIATRSLGTSQKDVLKLSKALIQGTLLSGTSAESARGSIIQLAQGLGTNFEAAGQEIRSIQENAPILAEIIAKAAGGTSDQLMKMAKEGKITSKIVVDAILKASEDLDSQYAKQQVLLSQGGIRLRDVGMKVIGMFNKWSGVSSKLANGLVRIANIVEDIVKSPITENFINIATMLAGFAAINLVTLGLTKLTAAIQIFRGWAVFIARAVGGWLPALRIVLGVLARFLLMWVIIPLAIEDFIGFLRGNKSLVGDLIAEMFGQDAAQGTLDTFRDSLWSVVDGLKILKAVVTGDELEMKELDAMKNRNDRVIGNIKRFFVETLTDENFDPESDTLAKYLEGPSAPVGFPADAVTREARNREARLPTAVTAAAAAGGAGAVINDNRTLNVNATASGAQAQQIQRAVGTELTRDRRAIAAQVGRR